FRLKDTSFELAEEIADPSLASVKQGLYHRQRAASVDRQERLQVEAIAGVALLLGARHQGLVVARLINQQLNQLVLQQRHVGGDHQRVVGLAGAQTAVNPAQRSGI